MKNLKSEKVKFLPMSQKIREILERQSELIAKQKKLIRKLNVELRKRSLKAEEVALVLQGVTLGLKNARKWFTFGIFVVIFVKKTVIFHKNPSTRINRTDSVLQTRTNTGVP